MTLSQKRRTKEQLKEQYLIERELADRLRHATAHDRQYLYAGVYDELFRKVPHHPQLSHKADPKTRSITARKQMRLLRRFLNPNAIFLEVGAGDCSLSFEASKHSKFVYALDVSEEITGNEAHPKNFKLMISPGGNLELPGSSVDVAYSNQLMEHLHPEDAFKQLQAIYKTLAPNGVYICITPNRMSGPHDISQFFDDTATGFHMKEYTISELEHVFRSAGFSSTITYIGGKGFYLRFPAALIKVTEHVLGALPFPMRKMVSGFLPIKAILGAIIVGKKQ